MTAQIILLSIIGIGLGYNFIKRRYFNTKTQEETPTNDSRLVHPHKTDEMQIMFDKFNKISKE